MKSLVQSTKKPLKSSLTLFSIISCIILLTLLALSSTANAQTDNELASQYKPVLHFTQGEIFYPTTVDYLIESSVLKQRNNDGTSPTIINVAPRADNLGIYSDNDLFLDNKLGTFEQISEDYTNKASTLGFHAYVHIVRHGSSTIIQYWLFYVFNNGPLNDHQGDIEVISVFIDSAGNPSQVLLSQHGGGQNAFWNDVEKVDNHPVVYVAQGSHANYFRSYQGKMGLENDVVGSDGKTIMPNDLNLVLLGDGGNHPSTQSWLDFKGRWGYLGTDEEVILGRAGPFGPVFNQDGIRWAQPEVYLGSTFRVDGNYLLLSLLVANFLLFFVIYIVARGAWKGWCIIKMVRKGGLLVFKFLKGRGGIGLMLGIVSILITVVALFVPWYTVTASSQIGPLAQEGGVTLLNMDGVNGLSVNMFVGSGNSDSTSGLTNLFSTQMPFAIAIGAGILFLVLDVIGIKSGKSLGKKFIFGIISSLMPVIFIVLIISQLSAIAPMAVGLFPGIAMPASVVNMLNSIAASPLQGTAIDIFPTIGTTTVTWGLGIGGYLFVLAALIKLIGGIIMYTSPELQQKNLPLPPPPPSSFNP